MSQDFNDPAFPLPNIDAIESMPLEAFGLTKLQWASIQIAAAMIVSGKSSEQVQSQAVKLAAQLLEDSAP